MSEFVGFEIPAERRHVDACRSDGLHHARFGNLLPAQPHERCVGCVIFALPLGAEGEPRTIDRRLRQDRPILVAGSGSARRWWPEDLGSPASAGAQNNLRYAFFPGRRRLAIEQEGRVRLYDTGAHMLSGFSQQQGGDQSLTFTSQLGLVRVADLQPVHSGEDQPLSSSPEPSSAAQPPRPAKTVSAAAPVATSGAAYAASPAPEEILKTIERLAELRRKDILTEEEFSAKKTELLARL